MNKRIEDFEASILALEQQQGRKFNPSDIAIYWEIWLDTLKDQNREKVQ